MYIEPNSTIKIYKNIPLDATYEHTIHFDSIGAQSGYFHSGANAKKVLTNNSYQRVKRGSMRVEVKADELYDCNYLAFQNTSFGNKWFYAFITSVEYVNNITSEITFELDSMQTYMFDVEYLPMYVEREHVMDDTVGANTVLEPIEYGEHIVQFTDNLYFGTPWKVVIHAVPNALAVTYQNYDVDTTQGVSEGSSHSTYTAHNVTEWNTKNIRGSIARNQYTSGRYFIEDLVATDINNMIDSLILDGYKIDKMYMCPSEFLDSSPGYFTPFFPRPTKYYGINDQEGYEPRNKKLLTFPYCFMKVTNNQGGEMDLRWEFFGGDTSRSNLFQVRKSLFNVVSADLRPDYESSDRRYRSLSLTDFPVLSWNESTDLSFIGKQLMNQIGTMAAYASPLGGVQSAIESAQGLTPGGVSASYKFAQIIGNKGINPTKATTPQQAQGNASNGYIDLENATFGYSFYSMGILPEYAKIVDEFLDKYGYQVNRLKVPNIDGRPIWNYVKTRNAVVKGNAPADEIRKICTILDNGITFWKSPSYVGRYDLDNTIS